MWNEQFEDILRTYLPFLPPDEALTESSSLRDFGLDSIGTIDLLSTLEKTYQVRFVDDLLSMETFATPGVLWTSLATLRESAT